MRFAAPGARILAVDDIEINLEIVQYMLKAFDVSCDLAMDGAEALRLVQEHKYDLIFMDHMMPVMDGFETAKRLRELDGYYAEVRIVALTANVISDSNKEFVQSMCNGMISKPIDKDELIKVLAETADAVKT